MRRRPFVSAAMVTAIAAAGLVSPVAGLVTARLRPDAGWPHAVLTIAAVLLTWSLDHLSKKRLPA